MLDFGSFVLSFVGLVVVLIKLNEKKESNLIYLTWQRLLSNLSLSPPPSF
ncbi:putative holin-like toxin [Listeria aquatica]|nr:putative holin-like toxin [Listeria aquatica]